MLFVLLFVALLWVALTQKTIVYNCPSCNAAVGDDNKFCANCGSDLPNAKRCPSCAKHFPSSVNFCPLCGKKTLDIGP